MFTKIEDDKEESQPQPQQYIAFKCGEVIFAGIYLGEKKASPFAIDGSQVPIFLVEEWLPIRLWK